MEKTTFNLKNFQKVAFYEGAKAQIHNQSRCIMNCYKMKMENGESAQKAWQNCLKEYNNDKKSGNWSEKYS